VSALDNKSATRQNFPIQSVPLTGLPDFLQQLIAKTL